MSSGHEDPCWIGVDPGGTGASGVALLPTRGVARTHCVSCADEAVDWISGTPLGVGVDAPLWWSSGRSSDRVADQWLRRTYRLHPGTVQTANSLRGAALVQAMMFVVRLRERFPGVPVTEVHPKGSALAHGGWDSDLLRGAIVGPQETEHERDAILAAVAAREGFERRWTLDLALERRPGEQDPATYWLQPVSYFWPRDGEFTTS